MKKIIRTILVIQCLVCVTFNLYSQSQSDLREFGITVGGLSNFPATKDYLKDNKPMVYVAPYVRAGKHEFSAGLLLPLNIKSLNFTDNNINPRLGFTAGYKFYIFNIYGIENVFIHYAFQYLRYGGKYDQFYSGSNETVHWTEKDMYINNVIGLGYNVFFDSKRRFGLYYTIDYVISQTGYNLGTDDFNDKTWTTNYVWNNLSTHIGFIFKVTSLNKKKE